MNYTSSVCIARANCAEHKRYFKSRLYMKHHPNGKLKNIMVFSALANFLLGSEFRISFIFTYFSFSFVILGGSDEEEGKFDHVG